MYPTLRPSSEMTLVVRPVKLFQVILVFPPHYQVQGNKLAKNHPKSHEHFFISSRYWNISCQVAWTPSTLECSHHDTSMEKCDFCWDKVIPPSRDCVTFVAAVVVLICFDMFHLVHDTTPVTPWLCRTMSDSTMGLGLDVLSWIYAPIKMVCKASKWGAKHVPINGHIKQTFTCAIMKTSMSHVNGIRIWYDMVVPAWESIAWL